MAERCKSGLRVLCSNHNQERMASRGPYSAIMTADRMPHLRPSRSNMQSQFPGEDHWSPHNFLPPVWRLLSSAPQSAFHRFLSSRYARLYFLPTAVLLVLSSKIRLLEDGGVQVESFSPYRSHLRCGFGPFAYFGTMKPLSKCPSTPPCSERNCLFCQTR
jgi:hypothetical protein